MKTTFVSKISLRFIVAVSIISISCTTVSAQRCPTPTILPGGTVSLTFDGHSMSLFSSGAMLVSTTGPIGGEVEAHVLPDPALDSLGEVEILIVSFDEVAGTFTVHQSVLIVRVTEANGTKHLIIVSRGRSPGDPGFAFSILNNRATVTCTQPSAPSSFQGVVTNATKNTIVVVDGTFGKLPTFINGQHTTINDQASTIASQAGLLSNLGAQLSDANAAVAAEQASVVALQAQVAALTALVDKAKSLRVVHRALVRLGRRLRFLANTRRVADLSRKLRGAARRLENIDTQNQEATNSINQALANLS